jgi:tetratricopeptide (TPR) repeat protein
LAIRRKHMPPNSVGIAQAAATVGMVLLELERPRDSIALLTEAMGIYDGQESAPAERIEPRLLLAAAYQQTGQAIQAKTIAQEAVEILHEEPQDAIRASAYWSLGKVLWEVAERQRAGELVLRARNMYLDLDSPNEVAELERWLRQRSIEFH